MAKDSKVMSSKPGNFAKGGSGKMFGQGGASPAKAGVTGKPNQGTNGGDVKGGRGRMFPKQSATPAKAGRTGK